MRHDPTPSGTVFRLVEIPPEKSVAGIDTAAARGADEVRAEQAHAEECDH